MSDDRRTIFEIIAEILDLCRDPQRKTRIMYNTNLSWAGAKYFLSLLESLKLLEVHHSIATYTTTERGFEFLEKWIQLMHLLTPEEVCVKDRKFAMHIAKDHLH
jgi:predicted transcriptional regulator